MVDLKILRCFLNQSEVANTNRVLLVSFYRALRQIHVFATLPSSRPVATSPFSNFIQIIPFVYCYYTHWADFF